MDRGEIHRKLLDLANGLLNCVDAVNDLLDEIDVDEWQAS